MQFINVYKIVSKIIFPGKVAIFVFMQRKKTRKFQQHKYYKI